MSERPFVSRSKDRAIKKAIVEVIPPRAHGESSGRSGVQRHISSVLLRWTALALVVVAVGITSTAWGAAFDFNDTSWEGCSELLKLSRQRLGEQRVVLAATVNFADLTPADGVVIVHPTTSLMMESLNDFMLTGGRVAVLDDFGSSGPFLERFEIRRINPPLRPADTLRGNPSLAWAVPAKVNPNSPNEGTHGLVTGLARVLTNHPTALTNPGLTPVLEIRTLEGEGYPLAVSGLIGKRGRLLVVGDPSIAINLMLRYPENRAFAEHVVDYMVSDDTWGPRGGKLYVLANSFSQVPTHQNLLSPQRIATRTRDAWVTLAQARIPEYGAWILGLVVAAVIGRKAWLDMGKRARAYRPKFVATIPLVSQPGVAGRAAVLGASSTPRALVMLEMMAGIRAYLASALSLGDSQQAASVFQLAREQQLINPAQHEALNAFAKLVVRIQTALATGGQARVRREEVNRAYRLLLDIVASIEHRQQSDSRATRDAPGDRTRS